MDLKKYLSEKKAMVESAMEDYFKDEADCPEVLKEAMLYSLRAGGKRLRPVLTLAAAEACGSRGKDVMFIALALEMIHTFSLIHDDLPAMDDDDLRRGKPTSHKKFGEATAVLAGDALLAEAFSCLSRGLSKDAKNAVKIIKCVADSAGARGMTGGQLLDMLAEGKKVSYDELKNIHKLKTGALIEAAIDAGAMAADANAKQLASLKDYGKCIGLAFQITDDILDIEATTEELGKPAKSDLANEKSTYPAILGLERSKKLAKELVETAFSSLAEFDAKADPLREIARYILLRKN